MQSNHLQRTFITGLGVNTPKRVVTVSLQTASCQSYMLPCTLQIWFLCLDLALHPGGPAATRAQVFQWHQCLNCVIGLFSFRFLSASHKPVISFPKWLV